MTRKTWLRLCLLTAVILGGVAAGLFFYRQSQEPEKLISQAERFYQNKNYEKAILSCLEAEKVIIKTHGEDSEVHASVLLKKGKIYYALNKYEDAFKCSYQAKKIFTACNTEEGLIAADLNLAEIAFQQKKYSETISLISEALKINQKIGYLKPAKLCSAQLSLAISYNNVNDLSAARQAFTQSIKTIKDIYGENSVEASRIFCYLGEIELKTGNIKEAESFFLRALKILEGHKNRSESGLAANYWGLARTFHQGKNYQQALAFASKALALLKTDDPQYSVIKQKISEWKN